MGDDEYRGEVSDPEVIERIRREHKAVKTAHGRLMTTLAEYGIEVVRDEPEPFRAAWSAAKAVKGSGPESAEVRLWAAKLMNPRLPLSSVGRIPGWVFEACERNLRGDALDELVRANANADFLKKYEEANSG
ncbi:hypothetical protein AB0A77_08100 [Streptomyces varsoviensis]|uniref:hypothetical protein n=1 Tax=Streptomyces varsoviensis TaxID=67373 RepID=UPI0033ECD06A